MTSRLSLCVIIALWTLLGAATVGVAQDVYLDHAEVVSQLHPEGTTGGTVYMDVWGYTAPDGTELVLLTTYEAVFFVDVTTPENPRIVYQFFAAIATHRDIRTWGQYAYSVNEAHSGMQIFDLTDPLHPEWVAQYDSTFTRAHNIGIYDGYAYIAGSRMGNDNAGMRILDLADPVHPVEVGVYDELYVHDVFARDNLAYVANINDARTTILDVSDKSNPTPVSVVHSGAATHQVWLTDDSRYLLTTHENAGGNLRIWDLQDLQNPQMVSFWGTSFDDGSRTDATIHNVFVRGDTAYAAYYAEGLQVIDISQIDNPRLVAEVDTRPTETNGFRGVWGVYPFADNGLIYCTDMVKGLYVVRLNTNEPQSEFLIQPPEPVVVQPGTSQLDVSFDVYNGSLFDEDFTVAITNSQGWQMTYAALLHVPRNATEYLSVRVTVPPGLAASTILDLEMCLTSSKTGDQGCGATTPATPILLQDLAAQWTPSGAVHLTWRAAPQETDADALVVLRRPQDDPQGWQVLAVLDWQQTQWADDAAQSAQSYVYALGQLLQGETVFLAHVELARRPPQRARLFGNTPNPFNPQTEVRFQLAQPGAVELRIHDARGRLIRVLQTHVDHTHEAAIAWDGRDARQRAQPSGVYLYQLRSGRWQARGNMTLVR